MSDEPEQSREPGWVECPACGQTTADADWADWWERLCEHCGAFLEE